MVGPVTKIKQKGVKIIMSPMSLEFYRNYRNRREEYLAADVDEGWVKVCVDDICAIHTPEYRWQFDAYVTCSDVVQLYKFMRRIVKKAPNWPVFKLITTSIADLEVLIHAACVRGNYKRRR